MTNRKWMNRILALALLVMIALPCLALAEVPSNLAGRTFNEGDEGWRIEELKAQLKTLGYYTPKAKYDDIFNESMVERVMEFQENNGMYPTGAIDPKTLELLFDEDCIKGEDYTGVGDEPDITLIIPLNSTFNFKRLKGDVMSAQVQVKNISQSRTVIGYDLSMYTVDDRGRKMEERVVSITAKVQPGKKSSGSYFDLQERSEIYEVNIAISGIRYSDGEYLRIPNPSWMRWVFD